MSQLLKKTETRVLLIVVVLLLLTEVLCQIFETRLSADVRHLRELPSVAQQLADAPADAEKILVVGNSLAREGIDLQLLEQMLNGSEKQGRPVTVAGFFPDATSISEWVWGYRRYFSSPATTPDRVLIVTGRTHLLGGSVNPERLGAFHIGGDDLGEALASMDMEQRPRVLLARYSVLFTNRDRLRPLLGYRLLPGYEPAMAEIVAVENRKALAAVDKNAKPTEPVELERLLKVTRGQGTDTTVITVPLPEDYALAESLVKTIEANRARFFDLSETGGLSAADFPDGYHLGKRGQKLFTERVAAEVLGKAARKPSDGR